MRRFLIIAAFVLLAGSSSVPAVASLRGDVRASAKDACDTLAGRHGADARGRDIARRGVRTTSGRRAATVRELREFRGTCARALSPAPPVFPQYSGGTVQAAGSAVATGAAYSSRNTGGLPACADESAGDYSTGPANTNPASGATGRWQTLRSHYSSGGICAGLDVNSPSGQDACAGRVYAEQGAGAWTNCG